MNYTLNYLYIILIVLISIYFFYKYQKKGEVKENFAQLNLPSFDRFKKMSEGYNCSKDMDSLDDKIADEFKIKTFCNQYPNDLTIDKLSTTLIDAPLKITRTKIKVFKTSDLNVNAISTGEMFKENSAMVLKGVPANANLGTFNLMEDECVKKCKENEICEYSLSVNPSLRRGANKTLGKCYLYNNRLDRSKIKNSGVTNNNSLYRKIKTIEFSISFWIKIDELVGRWRNIMHHGNKNQDRWPAFWIAPRRTDIYFRMRTNDKKPGQWPGGFEIAGSYLPVKKWNHVVFTISGTQMKAYVNGKLASSKTSQYFAVWPNDNRNVYIADPWHATGGFTLAKMKWYPFNLTADFVSNMAMTTLPVKASDRKEMKKLQRAASDKIVLTNNWEEDKRSDHIGLRIKDYNGIAFMDGIIKNGQINGIVGFLPNNIIPDRPISIMVGGSNGPYRMEILQNGQFSIFDGSSGGSQRPNRYRDMGRYMKDESIYLSNVRFPVSKGNSFRLRYSRQYKSYPTYVTRGSMVYFTGGFATRYYYPVRVPNSLRPQKSDLYNSISRGNNLARVDVRNWGGVANVLRDSTGVSLEGINYSIFNGERLKLKNGFWNYSGSNGYWSYAQVNMDNGIVSLKGLILRRRGAQPHNGLTRVDDENISSKGLNKNLGRRGDSSCANTAIAHGQKFIKRDPTGICVSGKYYNVTKPSWNNFRKMLNKYPGTVDRQSQIMYKKVDNTKINITQRKYNNNSFAWQTIMDHLNDYKTTVLPKNTQAKRFIAVLPASRGKWGRMPRNISGYVYVPPMRNAVNNPYLKLGVNNSWRQTTGSRGNQKFIDFTDKFAELRDGSYEIKIFNFRSYGETTLVKFKKQDGEYIETFNLKNKPPYSENNCPLPQKDPKNNSQYRCSSTGENFATYNKNTLTPAQQAYANKTWRSGIARRGHGYYACVQGCSGTCRLSRRNGSVMRNIKDKPNCANKATIYRLNERREIIATLPKKYWPMESHVFTTNCHSGTANILIDTIGNVVLIDQIGTTWNGISLAGISYLTDKIRSMGKGILKKIKVNRVLSWDDAEKLAKEYSGRLPTKQELDDDNVNNPAKIYNRSRDFWHPVSRTDGRKYDWAQIGIHSNRQRCKKYCSHTDTFGVSRWGRNRGFAPYRINGKPGRDFLYIKEEREKVVIAEDSDISLDRVINYNYGESFKNFGSDEEKNVYKTFKSNMVKLNPKMGEVKNGWCKGKAISSSPYPGCKEDCLVEEKCKGIRYIKNTGQCELLDNCTTPNTDARWGYALKK